MFSCAENKLLRKALAVYAGEHVLEHVLRNGSAALVPGGKNIDLTLLFVDLTGFAQVDALASPVKGRESPMALHALWPSNPPLQRDACRQSGSRP